MNPQDDGIDIVVLNCNNDGHIQTCINSIKAHTSGPFNLIVVDQNSNDGSREWLIDDDVAGHLILNKKNSGAAEGRNQGIRAGRHSWIIFIDSDIEIRDLDWLDKMWNYTVEHRIGFIEGVCRLGGWENRTKRASTSFCMIRRKCLNEIGIFDNNFLIGENIDWLIRLKWNKFWRSALCPDLNVCHFKGKTIYEGILMNKYEEINEYMAGLLLKKYNRGLIEEVRKELDL